MREKSGVYAPPRGGERSRETLEPRETPRVREERGSREAREESLSSVDREESLSPTGRASSKTSGAREERGSRGARKTNQPATGRGARGHRKTFLVGALAAALTVALLAVTITVALGQNGARVFAGDLFSATGYSGGFAPATESDPAGYLFTGAAPATVELAHPTAGEFELTFKMKTSSGELSFDDGEDEFTIPLRQSGSSLYVTTPTGDIALICDGEITAKARPAEETFVISASGGDVTLPAGSFSYNEYTVGYTAAGGEGEKSEILFTGINATPLDSAVARSGVPRVYAEIACDGVRGVPYIVPSPAVYEPSSGISHDASVRVTHKGATVLAEQKWSAGLSFPTAEEGVYTLTVSAATDYGVKEVSYDINVLTEFPESGVTLGNEFPFARVGTGSKVTLPEVLFTTSLYKSGFCHTQYIVTRDGEKISSGRSVDGVKFDFSEPGTYVFNYLSAEPYLDDTYSFTVEVSGDLPAIDYRRGDAGLYAGDAFTLPAASVTVGGKPASVETVLRFPSGKAVKNNTVLSEEGVYTLEFRCTLPGGGKYNYTHPFTAGALLHGEDNSAKFGSYDEGYFPGGQEGLLIELKSGHTYEFGNVLDLSSLRFPDAYDFMGVYLLPYTRGVRDIGELNIRLTDAYDPDIYVDINILDDEEHVALSYTKAKGSNQDELVGLKMDSVDKQSPVRGGIYGYITRISFTGLDNPSYSGGYIKAGMNLGWDNETATLYGTHGWNANGTFGDAAKVITRLKDTALYKEAFPGFTTGEVRLSIWGGNFSSSTARLLVTELAGQDLRDTVVTDTAGPVITPNLKTGGSSKEEYSPDNLPRAVVGKAYPFFPATAADARSGKTTVTRRVLKSDGHREYFVSTDDGSFTPTEAGTYTLLYTARDFYGNETELRLPVTAVSELPLEATLARHRESALCGENVATAEYTLSGGSGAPRLRKLSVTDPSGKAVKLGGGAFTPEKAGDYTVTYSFTDYIKQETTLSYTVKVAAGDLPVLNTDPVLPRALLDGGKYTLPVPAAADYSSGSKKEVTPEVYVTDGAARRKADGGAFTAAGNNGTTATVTYVWRGGKGELTREYKIPVRRLYVGDKANGDFNVAGLIIPQNAALTTVEGNANYFLRANGGASFFFANTLLADGFNFNFNIGVRGADNPALGAVRLTLTDSGNPSQSIAVTISPNPEDRLTSLLSVNGGTEYVINGTFDHVTNYYFSIGYDAATKSVTSAGTLSVAVAEYSGGGKFRGFSSGLVWAAVEFLDAEPGVMMELINVNGQPLTSADMKDRIHPSYALQSPVKPTYSLDQTLKLTPATVADVLSTEAHIQLSLKLPGGSYAKATNGKVLQNVDPARYNVKLSTAGAWVLTLTVWDDNGGPASEVNVTVNVLDETPPVVSAEKKSLKANVGEAIDVTGIFSVKKDADKNLPKVYVYYKSKEGILTATGESGTAVFSKAGTYTLYGIAYDEAGNMGYATVKVTVGGAK